MSPNPLTVDQYLAIGLVKFYQVIKPLLDGLIMAVFGYVSHCKHTPSCSEYTIQQIRKHGTITGLKKGLRQLSRCH